MVEIFVIFDLGYLVFGWNFICDIFKSNFEGCFGIVGDDIFGVGWFFI